MFDKSFTGSATYKARAMSVRSVDFLPFVSRTLKPCWRWRHRWLASDHYMPGFSNIPIKVNWQVCERCGWHRQPERWGRGWEPERWGRGWEMW